LFQEIRRFAGAESEKKPQGSADSALRYKPSHNDVRT
jgi:hypothetical protein